MSAEQVARDFAQRLDERDWDGLAALLAPTCRVTFKHNAWVFERDDWIRHLASSPFETGFRLEDLVATADRAVLRAHLPHESFNSYVACFLRVYDGVVTEVVEVWADDSAGWDEEL